MSQHRQGFFLPVELHAELMELLDEQPHKRVKKLSRAMESLSVVTVNPEAPTATQPQGPPEDEGDRPAGQEEGAQVTKLKKGSA